MSLDYMCFCKYTHLLSNWDQLENFQECWLRDDQSQLSSEHESKLQNHNLHIIITVTVHGLVFSCLIGFPSQVTQ